MLKIKKPSVSQIRITDRSELGKSAACHHMKISSSIIGENLAEVKKPGPFAEIEGSHPARLSCYTLFSALPDLSVPT